MFKVGNFKAGKLVKQDNYRSFSPELINKSFLITDSKINVLLEEAIRYLGELNAFSQLVPDVDFFIHMHVVKEATTSSRIEGTNTSFEDALMNEENIQPGQIDDWREVQNYTEAMNFSIAELKNLPLSMRLLCTAHKILLTGTRGQHKTPGEIRRSQNWIGGSCLKDAFFIPPHHAELPGLLTDLEKYWHNADLNVPHLIRVALSHYQFETIHPFQDGNGRIGRLLIPLYLVEKGILTKPTLYLSDFFARNKGSYYDALTIVRASNDINQWLKFFLVGTAETAKAGKQVFEKIISLRIDCERRLTAIGKRQKLGLDLLRILYSSPVITAQDIIDSLRVTSPTAHALLREFVKLGILKELPRQRSKVFIFTTYIEIFS